MKRAFLVLSLAAALFIVGLFAASPLLAMAQSQLDRPILSVSVQESLAFHLSSGLVLASTPAAATLLYWAYFRRRPAASPVIPYTIALAIATSSLLAAIVLRLILLRTLLERFLGLPSGTGIRPQMLGLLPWGLGGMFPICAGIAAAFLAADRSIPRLAE